MEKKLPKVYVNQINKQINNNEKVYKSNTKNNNETQKTEKDRRTQSTTKKVKKTISQKITEIMNTKKYIYKVPVKIYLKDKEINTNIIGKNSKNIITIDNELIKIDEIQNIEIEE